VLPRERSAWIWLFALIIVFGAYFTTISVLQRAPEQVSFVMQISLLATALLTLALVAGLDWLVVFIRDRRDATPFDERDRLIELRSSSYAYYVLIGGMIVVGCVMPFSANGWDIVHAALFAIFVAEIVHHGLVVLGYRRGWHV